MEEDGTILTVKMAASELGYTVKWIRTADASEHDILVLENENDEHCHSFVGANKLEIALEWLRQKA